MARTATHPIGPVTSGLLRGIEDGWFTSEIADAAFTYQTTLEKGDKLVVGVNAHTATVSGELEILRVSHEVELSSGRCSPLVAPPAMTPWSPEH